MKRKTGNRFREISNWINRCLRISPDRNQNRGTSRVALSSRSLSSLGICCFRTLKFFKLCIEFIHLLSCFRISIRAFRATSSVIDLSASASTAVRGILPIFNLIGPNINEASNLNSNLHLPFFLFHFPRNFHVGIFRLTFTLPAKTNG